MADSSGEDEFASTFNDGTTPYRVTKVATAVGRSKPNGRAVAGPSSKPSKAKPRQKRAVSPQAASEDDFGPQLDLEDAVESGGSEIDRVATTVVPLAKGKGKKAAVRLPDFNSMVKGNPVAKGKTKVKAEPPAKKMRSNAVVEAMDVDGADEIEEMEQELLQRAKAQPVKSARGRQRIGETSESNEDALRSELERVQQELRDVSTQRSALAAQLEEVFHIRNTEPEEAMVQQANQYEVRLKTQEEMIQELTSQLARVDSLTRAGKTSTLHFLTREAADEERRATEKEVQRLLNIIKERDLTIAQKDGKIHEQEETIRTLESDLKVEIEHTKTITARNTSREAPSSATRGRPLPSQSRADPWKHGKVIRFYEDITNFVITDVKLENPSVQDNDEIMYDCFFTHASSRKALNFVLRTYWDVADPDASGDQPIVEKVMYTPLQLENESETFVEKLGYLSGSFVFLHDQLLVFVKTIDTKLEEIFVGGEEGEA